MTNSNDALRAVLEKAAVRLEICANYIEGSFNISGTQRAERTMIARRFSLEARKDIQVYTARKSADMVIDFNNSVRDGTLINDPRQDSSHPLHDIVCGWCGEIHKAVANDADDRP